MKNDIEIQDNFLSIEAFANLAKAMMSNQFPWVFSPYVVFMPGQEEFVKDEEYFQFNHNFYKDYTFQSPYTEVIWPCIEKLYALALCGIKANLQTQTDEIKQNKLHTDIGLNVAPEKVAALTTGILYINPNNGYTLFEDGTKIESVPNRYVKFPANTKHTGTTCTDEKARILINFNYYEAKEIIEESEQIRYNRRMELMKEGEEAQYQERMRTNT